MEHLRAFVEIYAAFWEHLGNINGNFGNSRRNQIKCIILDMWMDKGMMDEWVDGWVEKLF